MNTKSLLSVAIALSIVIGSGLPANAADPADPTIGEWKTFGNGPSHTGFYPSTIGNVPIVPGWTLTLGVPINQPVVSGTRIYLTTNQYSGANYAAALSTSDGTEIWRNPLPAAYSVNPPTYDSGRVLFQRCNHSGDTFLYALDANTGALVWAAPHSAQWENYQAPTVYGDGVWVNGGSYGGMYGFDSLTGSRRFFISLPQEDRWTPSYYGGVVYSCVTGVLKAHNPNTGVESWKVDLRLPGSTWSEAGIVAIMNDRAFVIGHDGLVAIDLVNRRVLWRANGTFFGTPATDGDVVYVIAVHAVNAYSCATGDLLGTYLSDGYVIGQPIILNDAILAAGAGATYVYNRASFTLRTILNSGGSLSYTKGVIYTADTNGKLATYNVQLSEPEPTPLPSATPTPPVPIPTATVSIQPIPSGTPFPTPTPAPSASPSPPMWIDAKSANKVAYFIFQGPPSRLERFDMQANKWLPSVALSGFATALAVDETGIYISLGRRTVRLALNTLEETTLLNTATDVDGLVISGSYLCLASGRQFTSTVKDTGVIRSTRNYPYAMKGFSAAPTRNKIFARNAGYPGGMMHVTLDSQGILATQFLLPNNWYPDATRTYLFPNDDSKVADNGGIIYDTADLAYVYSLGGAATDLGVANDGTMVALRGNKLISYSGAFLETGRTDLVSAPLRIFVSDTFVYSFYREDARGVSERRTPLSALRPRTAFTRIDATHLAYTPDQIVTGEDGVLYLLSRANLSVFRWSIPEQRYLPPIGLVEAPSLITYSFVTHALYLAYSSGAFHQISPATSLNELPLMNLPWEPKGLATAGEFLFVNAGLTNTHYIFDSNGTLLSSQGTNVFSQEYIWSAPHRKMYYFRDGTSSNGLFWESIDPSGHLETIFESPSPSDGTTRPIRISPDGNTAVLGSGRIFDATSLTLTNTLPTNIADANWLSQNLYSLRPFGPNTQLQAWNNNYVQTDYALIAGTPLRLLAHGPNLTAITMVGGYPVFTELDSNLNPLFQSAPGPTPVPTPTPIPVPPTPAPTSTPAGTPEPGATPTPTPSKNPNQPAWTDAKAANNIAYFIFQGTLPHLERFDLQTNTWLSSIPLSGAPTAIAVDDTGIYVSFGRRTVRLALDGSNETHLLNTVTDITTLVTNGDYLYLSDGGSSYLIQFISLVKATGVVREKKTVPYGMVGLTVAPTRSRIYGRSSTISPADIIQLVILPDGTFGTQSASGNYGLYPTATRTYMFPDESKVADNAGTIFNTNNLAYVNTYSGALTDLDFSADHSVVLRNTSLIGYSNSFQETGRVDLTGSPLRIFVSGNFVYSFYRGDTRGVFQVRTPLSGLLPASTPTP